MLTASDARPLIAALYLGYPGFLLLAAAAIRARAPECYASWLVIVGVLVAPATTVLFAASLFAGVLLALGLVGWGDALWRGDVADEPPEIAGSSVTSVDACNVTSSPR